MEFVCNANFRGEFYKNIDLQEMRKKIPNSSLSIKPQQLVVKDPKGTLVLFGSGKFRTMCCIDELEASSLACKYLEKVAPFLSFPFITLQSYSLRSQLGFHVNLSKMASCVLCMYEPELFPALR